MILSLLLILDKSCKKPTSIFRTETYVDTIRTSDTIWAKDTIRKLVYLNRPKAKDSVFIHDTIVKEILKSVYTEPCSYLRIYQDSVSDKNVTFFYHDTVYGVLLSREISYRLKVPLIINNTETITKTTQQNKRLYVGFETGFNKKINYFELTPQIAVNLKRRTYIYGYDLINKTHKIGIHFQLFPMKKSQK